MRSTTWMVRVIAGALVLTATAPAARAGIPKILFGPQLDREAPSYDRENSCDPDPERGVLAFQRFIMRAFPNTGEGNISRSCSAATSEHEEGRAWDWMVSVYDRSDRRAANAVLDWLLSRDSWGRRHAMANRVGLMYLIWNRRIWTPWYGWRNYYRSNPHTDHIHFSFTWRGARKRTTFYHRQRSFVSAAVAKPRTQGLWAVTGGGAVFAAAPSRFFGDRSRGPLNPPVVGIAPERGGDGYWLATRSGRVLAFGDARSRGGAPPGVRVAEIASTRTGRGYWLVGRRGRVFAFGDAGNRGSPSRPIVTAGFARARTIGGYWIVSRRGRVFAFGSAERLGGLRSRDVVVTGLATSAGSGYWIATRRGRVIPFGDAAFHGDLSRADLRSPVVSIAASPTGNGYRLVTAMGRIFSFGDATDMSLRTSSTARARTSRVPPPSVLDSLLQLDVDRLPGPQD